MTLRDTIQTGREKLAVLSYGLAGASRAPQDTVGDLDARQKQGFAEVESRLPTGIGGAPDSGLVERVSSYFLGDRNPFATEATAKDEIVWLLDNTAYKPNGDENAEWEAEFVAAYFARASGKDLGEAVADIADKIGVDDGHIGESSSARDTIDRRLRPFAADIRPARYVNITWGQQETFQLGPGNSNAISSQIIGQLGSHEEGDIVKSAPLQSDLDPYAPSSTFFAEPEGWTVISDIDDTIKHTMTCSPLGVLQSTFFDNPSPIKGMPELYQHISHSFKPNWFYLSASPYNLYTFLRPFLLAHYPPGTTILRDASWRDLNGLLQSLTVGTEAYKSDRCEKIHSWLPKRKLICLGDSTQSDPEVYGSMYRKFPGWIKAIFVRKVTGIAGMDETKKNSDERFENALKDVPRSVWRVFEDPNELYNAIDSLKTI